MARTRDRRAWLATLALTAALALAACGGDKAPATVEADQTPMPTATPVSTTTPTPPPSPTAAPTSLPPLPLTMTLCHNIIALQEKAQVTTDVVPEGGPCLATISEGSETELILEWAGGPANATKWQYRQRTFRQPWPAWTDIPGSGASTSSYRVSGLKADSGYFFEVRAWTEDGPGTESNEADGVTTTRSYVGLPLMLIGQVAEGGRSWVLGGNVIVDIPAGVRVMHSSGALSARTVVFTMSEIESMSAQVFDLETGEAAGRVIRTAGTATASDLNTLFDQILASARLVPDSTPTPAPQPPTPPHTTFRYDKLDTTGAVTTAGSYAFLKKAGDAASAIGNFGYSAESSVELRIHPTDAAGASRSTLYDTVKIGDSFDYQTGPECAFRFKVTSVSASATPRVFGIERVGSYGGWCEGFVDNPGAARDVSFVWWPGAGYAGPDGVRVLLFGEPTGEGTYRLLPGSDWVLDIPAGIRIIMDGYWILEPGEDDPPDAPRAVVPLIDEASGSRLLLDPIRGKEIERHISQQPESSSSRDVNALFDQIIASIRRSDR